MFFLKMNIVDNINCQMLNGFLMSIIFKEGAVCKNSLRHDWNGIASITIQGSVKVQATAT